MSNSESKKSYEVLKPIGFGGRREKGEILELTQAEAENFGADYVQEVGTAPKVSAGDETPIEKMKLAELREKAEKLGLDTEGSKADLVERITLHLQENA